MILMTAISMLVLVLVVNMVLTVILSMMGFLMFFDSCNHGVAGDCSMWGFKFFFGLMDNFIAPRQRVKFR